MDTESLWHAEKKGCVRKKKGIFHGGTGNKCQGLREDSNSNVFI